MTIDIEPGIYRLTKDMPAIAPDIRKVRDWRAGPVNAGTLFAVLRENFSHVEGAPDCFAMTMHHLDGYSHERVFITARAQEYVAAFERVENPSATEHLQYRGNHGYRGEILNRLCEKYGIGPKDLDAMCAEIEKEIDDQLGEEGKDAL